MFYKFNQITQALSGANQEISMAQCLNQKPLEPSNIQYEYATSKPKTAAIHQKTPTQTGYPVPNNPRYRKLMDLQTKFSMMPKNMPLYYTTIVLVTAGFGLTVYSLIKLATPPENN